MLDHPLAEQVKGNEIYKAEKYTQMYFLMTVLSEGNMVAKVSQPGMNNKKLEVEVGTGVDILMVAMLTMMVGAISGSGAGGLAGAGVV